MRTVTEAGEEHRIGELMHDWIKDLYPICRSITGPGVRSTLGYLGRLLPDLHIEEVPSGTKAFDWVVPDEWTIRGAYVLDENGKTILDFKQHNLHVVGYSESVDRWLSLEELDKHLYSLPKQPDAIPYVTSYYDRRWGFCLSHEQRTSLKPGQYHAVIDSDLKPGVLNYAELILPGKVDDEVFLSTYVCHPSMGDHELSGPTVTTALARWLMSLESRRYTYRIVFVPETIGSIVYLSRNLEHLKQKVVAGFNITCVGDDRCYSYLPSRSGNSLSDRVALHVLHHTDRSFKRYTWLERGSDERQYCSPGVDLPIATIMRSKYGQFPEYHTSLDDLNFVTPTGLEGAYAVLRRAIEAIENNSPLAATVSCEPQMGKRGLYSTLSGVGSAANSRQMMDILSYADGRDLLSIAETLDVPIWELDSVISVLVDNGLISLEGSQ